MSGRTVLVGAAPAPWAAQRARATDRLLGRLLGASLDRRRGPGEAPEASRLPAVRGQQIGAPPHRRQLAGTWEPLLAMAAEGPPNRPRALLCQGRIVAA